MFKRSNNLGVISFEVNDVTRMQDPEKVEFKNTNETLCFTPSHTFQGGACLVRKQAFVESGMYPEDFHYGTEERDLSIRLIDNDYSIVRTKDVTLLHYNPSKVMASGIYKPYHYYRNVIRHYWRTYPLEHAIIETIVKIPSAILRCYSSNERRAHLRGLVAGLVSIPKTIKYDRSPVHRSAYNQQNNLEDSSWIERTISLFKDIV
jgi:GT2 family glycosyltransferase